MNDPMTTVFASATTKAARDAMVAAFRPYATDLSTVELLAVAAQLVGQLIAMQDQRRVSPAQAMAIVEANMQIGNASAIERLATEVAGRGCPRVSTDTDPGQASCQGQRTRRRGADRTTPEGGTSW